MRTSTVLVSTLALVAALTTSVAMAAGEPLQPVLTDYFEIQDALARDTTDGVAAAATRIQQESEKLQAPAGFPMLPKQIGQGARNLAAAEDLPAAREAFKALSAPLVAWAQSAKPMGVVALHCDTANASWLQATLPVRNPYFGASMLSCGRQLASGDAGDSMGGKGHMGPMDMAHGGHHH